MTDDQSPIQFPQYAPPKGIPVADPKFHKPLYKMARMMAKMKSPKLKTTRPSFGRRKKAKVQ